MINRKVVMAEKKKDWTNNNKGSQKTSKTPKRPKNWEPGFFNDYGGSGIIVTHLPDGNPMKNKKKK